jgi:hypothetical protein
MNGWFVGRKEGKGWDGEEGEDMKRGVDKANHIRAGTVVRNSQTFTFPQKWPLARCVSLPFRGRYLSRLLLHRHISALAHNKHNRV